MANNPFASLFGGLLGGLTTSTPKTTYASSLMSKAPTNYSLVSSPYSANKTAASGSAPYIPSTQTTGGKSLVPTATSVATKLPSATGGTTPSGVSSYLPQSSVTPKQLTPKETYAQRQTPTSYGTPSATSPTLDSSPSPATFSSAGVGSSGGSSGAGGASFGGAAPYSSFGSSTSSARAKYLDLLSGIYADDELKSANKGLQDIVKRQSEAELRARKEEEDIRKNESGALARGVNAQLSESSRLSSKELADLAIAAKPYQSYIENAMNAAKTAADFETEQSKLNEPFTLSAGQTRYSYNNQTGRYEPVGGGGGSDVNDSVLQAWAQGVKTGQYDISNVPSEIRNEVALAVQGLPASASPQVQEAITKASQILGEGGQGGLINEALGLLGTGTTGIIGSIGNKIPGSPGYNLSKIVDTIKANLGFQELAAMRAASPTGGALGQVTERELNFLQSTVASLDLAQSETQIRKNLEKIKTHYENWLDAVKQAHGSQGGGGGGDEDYSF